MIKSVMFVSRHAAESNYGVPGWVMISITEGGAYFSNASLNGGWSHVLRTAFHDSDPTEGHDELRLHMTPEQAREIVAFVRRVAPEVDGIMVHCHAGVSRSAAVAKWIAIECKLPFDHLYDKYNRYVFQLMEKAGREP